MRLRVYILAIRRWVRMYLQSLQAMRFCVVMILFRRSAFGQDRNKIFYEQYVYIFCYMYNLWYNILIVQHICILCNTRSEISYFVFNSGSFERTPWVWPQVLYFLEIFAKKSNLHFRRPFTEKNAQLSAAITLSMCNNSYVLHKN